MGACCRCKKAIVDEQEWYGLHENCFVEWFGLSALDHFSDIIPRSQSLVPLENYGTNTSFFHGAFRKYSSRLGEDNYILKVVQKEHPELPATEGAIFTKKTDEPTIKDYVDEWNRLGYEKVVQSFRKRFSIEKLSGIIEGSFIGEKRKKALFRLISKRGEELCGN
jgi:hypothetical protein